MEYFQNELCHLVALGKSHLTYVLNWINDERISNSSGPRFPISEDQQIKWIEKTITSTDKKKLVILDIEEQPVGLVSIMNIDQRNRNAEVGVYVDPDYMGKGYAYNSLKMVLSFAFNEMNLFKLYANIHEENLPSIRLFEKLGFRKEWTQRKTLFKNGKYIDIHGYSIFNENIHN